jgi:DNA replication and repair protein RecF
VHITRLRLTAFRNHGFTDLRFASGVNVLLGENGQGKTNVVEAINLLASGTSHRTHQLMALVRAGSADAIVNAELVHDERSLSVDVQLDTAGANKARANGNAIRMRELSRHIHVVFFAPEDLAIIRDDPEERRMFLDAIVTVLSPRMIGVFSDYERAVKQRNSLLKSLRHVARPQRDLSTLAIWDEKIVALGTEITFTRLAAVTALREPLSLAYQSIAGRAQSTNIMLSSRISETLRETSTRNEIGDKFATAMIGALDDDLERGTTSIGPHRDDVLFTLNELPVKGYASHGETWSFALSLKLATAELFRHESLGDPIVILDDVFAELDVARRDRLTNAVSGFEQVIITAAVKADVPDLAIARTFFVESGVVKEMYEA